MPTYRITAPDGKSYDVNAPEGASQDEVLAYAQRSFKMAATPAAPKPAKPFGQQLNEAISDVPRQLGLTARYGAEGVGGALDFLATPFRAGLNAILPKKQTMAGMITGAAPQEAITGNSGTVLADMLGLPQPRTSQERVVADATRMLAGAGVPFAGAARVASAAPLGGTVAGNVARTMATNPGAQLASAGASGLAGGYTRETGGNEGSQLAAALAAGLAAPAALGGAQRLGAAAARTGRSLTAPAAAPQVQVDVRINNALQDSGLTLADLPASVAASIRRDVGAALRTGENLSDDAVHRLADYRATGLTPTAARLTLNPADVTRQANLAKLGANSNDPAAQALANVQNANNRQLTAGLNSLGANTTDDQIAGATRIMDALGARNSRAKTIIDTAYQGARDSQGRAAALDPSSFTRRANDMLDDALLGGKLPADVRNLLNRTASGEMPLTVDVAEQFKTRIGELQRATTDMAERKALGMVRGALDDTPLLPGQEIGQQSVNAFNKARALNRSWMNIVDRTPALQAVRDGIEPDKFVQKFIIGGGDGASVMSLAQLRNSIKSSPDALGAVKEQILGFLKSKALSGAADEVGNFSQSGFNSALRSIGDRKLALFFPKEELNQLKALGRVASYEQVQPVGAAVNNSNTAGAVGGLLERVGGSQLLGKIPFGRAAIGEPLQNILIGRQAGAALNAPGALIGAPVRPSMRAPLPLSPAAFMLPGEDEQQ